MKNKYLIFEFALIFLFLALPPLFISAGSGTRTVSAVLSPSVILQFVISAYILCRTRLLKTKSCDERRQRIICIVRSSWWWAICFGILMLTFAFFQILSLVFSIGGEQEIILEDMNFFRAMTLFLIFATGAFYEEIIYRDYLPETIHHFTGQKNTILNISRQKYTIIIEGMIILIFAFSHRYMGITAVMNAAVSGFTLRLCRKKTGSIWAGFIAHFLYNLMMLAFIWSGSK